MYYRLLFLILLEITAALGAFRDHNYIRSHLLLPILKLDIGTYQWKMKAEIFLNLSIIPIRIPFGRQTILSEA